MAIKDEHATTRSYHHIIFIQILYTIEFNPTVLVIMQNSNAPSYSQTEHRQTSSELSKQANTTEQGKLRATQANMAEQGKLRQAGQAPS